MNSRRGTGTSVWPTLVRGFKYSDDYTDAYYLAECVRNGSIRSTAIIPKDDRAVRDLARYRMTLVEDRGRLKTILVNMTANHLSIKLNADKLLKEIDEAIERAASSTDERGGGGYVTSMLIGLEIGDIGRFQHRTPSCRDLDLD